MVLRNCCATFKLIIFSLDWSHILDLNFENWYKWNFIICSFCLVFRNPISFRKLIRQLICKALYLHDSIRGKKIKSPLHPSQQTFSTVVESEGAACRPLWHTRTRNVTGILTDHNICLQRVFISFPSACGPAQMKMIRKYKEIIEVFLHKYSQMSVKLVRNVHQHCCYSELVFTEYWRAACYSICESYSAWLCLKATYSTMCIRGVSLDYQDVNMQRW